MKRFNFLVVALFFICVSYADPGASSSPSKQVSKGNIHTVKEAFVNVPICFDQSEMGKELHKEMVAEARKFQAELEKKSQDIERAKKELSNKVAAMSSDAVRQEEKRIAQLERDLSVQIKEKEEDFQMMAAKKEQAWAQEFQQVVTDWAQEFHFEKVWDEVTGRPLYIDNKLKHTDEIIESMNKRNSDKKSTSLTVEKSKDSSVKKV
jgi:Skp family chaperone for outer membrane proteins